MSYMSNMSDKNEAKITKQDLKNLSADYMKVQDLKQQIADIREAGAIAAQRYNSVPNNVPVYYRDQLADKVDRLDEIKDEYTEAQLQCAERNRAVLNAIQKLGSPYYAVIKKRYLDNLSWRKIALDMNYSESNIRKIHDKALILLQQ